MGKYITVVSDGAADCNGGKKANEDDGLDLCGGVSGVFGSLYQ